MNVRLSMVVEESVAKELRLIARQEGVSVDTLLVRGLVAMQIFAEQRKLGRNHMGFVADATKLDAQLIFR